MKRHSNEWSKVLLAAYRYLPDAVEAAKAEAERLALSGFGYQGDTLELIEEILGCTRRCENYVNASVLVRESLRRLGSERAALLVMHYCDRRKIADVAAWLGIAPRTAFRRIGDALHGFESAMRCQGYDEQWYEQRFGGDMLFCRIAQELASRSCLAGEGAASDSDRELSKPERRRGMYKKRAPIKGRAEGVARQSE